MLVWNSPGIQSWWCDDGNRTTNLLIGSITRYHHSRLTWRRRYQPYQTKRTIISTQSEASARNDTCDFLKYSSPVRRRIETCFWLFDRDFVTLVWVSWRPPEKKNGKSLHTNMANMNLRWCACVALATCARKGQTKGAARASERQLLCCLSVLLILVLSLSLSRDTCVVCCTYECECQSGQDSVFSGLLHWFVRIADRLRLRKLVRLCCV